MKTTQRNYLVRNVPMRRFGLHGIFLVLLLAYSVPKAGARRKYIKTKKYVLEYGKSKCSQPGGLDVGPLDKPYDPAECAVRIESKPECEGSTVYWVKGTNCVCMLRGKENEECKSRSDDRLSMVYKFLPDQGEESNEYCELNGGIPINFEFILSKQVTLREKGYTACELGRNDVENQEKFAACLAAIGFDGYRYRGELTDWTCSAPTAVDSCGGLECAEGYIGEVLFECRNAIQIPRTNTKHYQEQASKPNPDLSLFPAVGGQGFYVPTGCFYDPRWDPDYACVGGQEWNACGTPCIRTCHYRPDPERCSPGCFARCQCPEAKPVWDREYGCITQELCDQYYGSAQGETLEQIYNPVKPAMPYPYGWAGARKS